MTETMISTENLTKSFGDNLAVDRPSITIPAGEVFGLLGPNGAGKTTTIGWFFARFSSNPLSSERMGYSREELLICVIARMLDGCRDIAVGTASQAAAGSGAAGKWGGAIDADGEQAAFPNTLNLQYRQVQTMRYGENPHQRAAFFVEHAPKEASVATAIQIFMPDQAPPFSSMR